MASAIDGGANAAIRASDLTVAEESDRALLRRVDLGIWGSVGSWTRLGWLEEEREISGLYRERASRDENAL
ncbi:hypothetical protein DY000_02027752 [Brassica cretica]|uniref:Uncharacterized protein n=1 Tax=Brassica cretica TaxID=69181 RepID=A0ABQ7EMI4_BRACR|nr:hypothetical protein DY000_02027752 [Brassica cretica]